MTAEEKAMNQWKHGARRKAAAAAAFLLLAGGLLGVLVDRLWLFPRGVEAMPLTAQALAARLDLGPSEEAQIRALLDSIHAEVMAAAQQGADSLRTTARSAHLRLEAVLPPDTRPEFRAWMQDHHRWMMERISDARLHGPGSMGREGSGMHDEH
jgi:hypothetical protein